jgi:glycine dehydrogenase subunit 2
MSGFEVVHLPSDARGNVDLNALRELCDERLAGLMLTNPNTLGLFDENVTAVIEMVHSAGGLVYGDGANLNALLGIVRPGDLGFDIIAHQPAQDLLYPSRRRRTRLRSSSGSPCAGGIPA